MMTSLVVVVSLAVGQTNSNPPPAAGPIPAPTIGSQTPPPPNGTAGANGGADGTSNGNGAGETSNPDPGLFPKRFLGEYPALAEWFPKWLGKPETKNGNGEPEAEPFRRALPGPLPS